MLAVSLQGVSVTECTSLPIELSKSIELIIKSVFRGGEEGALLAAAHIDPPNMVVSTGSLMN